MPNKKKLIPFKYLPASWGLKGKSYTRAKLEYELSGIELAIKLAELDFNGKTLSQKLLEIDKEFNVIDEETFERDYRKLEATTDLDKQLIDLEVDLKFKKIIDKEYAKKRSTLMNEPWVDILGLDMKKGAFDLDWNDQFVDELRQKGYQGMNSVAIVQNWFDTLCSQIAIESGILGVNADDEPIIKNTKLDGGFTEYS